MVGPNANFITGGLIGLGVQNGNDGNVAKFAVGTIMEGNKNSRWLYVVSQTVVTQFDAVKVDPTFTAASLTETNGITAGFLGFAQVAFVTSDFGWVMIGGKPTVRLAASVQPGVPLYVSTTTAGVLQSTFTSASAVALLGVIAETSASAGGVQATTCDASWPILRRITAV